LEFYIALALAALAQQKEGKSHLIPVSIAFRRISRVPWVTISAND
jgi:hypothetical protein